MPDFVTHEGGTQIPPQALVDLAAARRAASALGRTLFARPLLDRDDYAQEAAIAIWRGDNVKRRLIDVTRQATHHRTANRLTFVELKDAPGGDATVSAVLEREEVAETVAAVLQLPARQRACVSRLAVGESLTDIAAAEGLTYKQVDNAVMLARKTLRARRAA